MTTPAAISAHSLTRLYGRHVALNDINLAIPPGAICALVGANGAGKTTLIKILSNLLLPTSGCASMLDVDSKFLDRTVLQRFGYVSENQELPLWMTTRQFLAYLRPFYPQWDTELEAGFLRLLDIPLDRKLKQLSRGQRMKTAFVAALAYRPQVAILDEPFSGLDPLVREELIDARRNISWPATFLISSHDLDEIESLATHLVFIDKGNILFADALSTVRNRFRSCRFEMPADQAIDPATLPSTWTGLRTEAGPIATIYQFNIEREGGADAVREDVIAHAPAAFNIESFPLSLRNIFLNVARIQRSKGPQKEHARA